MEAHVRTIIVTGGTGALGRCVVQRFLASEDLVVVPWISKPEREDAARLWGDALPSGRVALIEADVATPEGAQRVAEAAPEVDVLVNGAGGFDGGAPVYETSIDLWDTLYRTNVRTAVCMSQAVLPGMLRRRRGTILCVTSQAAVTRPAGIAAYSASKSALAAFVETLQKELAPTALRVNAVSPTTIDTEANRRAMPHADFTAWTPPEQIAEALHWLASSAATPIRGALIPV